MGKFGHFKKKYWPKKQKHPKEKGQLSSAVPGPEPTTSSSAGQHNSTSDEGAQEMQVSSDNVGSVVSASNGRQTHGNLTSPAASSDGLVTQATSDMARLQIQGGAGAPTAAEMLAGAQAQGMGWGLTAGIIAGSVNDYGVSTKVIQAGPAGSRTVGVMADYVTHHVGSTQIEVVLGGNGPGPQGFAAGTVAGRVENYGTAYRNYGGHGDFPNFGTASYPSEEEMGDESTPEQPPTTQPISTGPGVNPPVLGMVRQLIPGVTTINSVVTNQTVVGRENDIVDQAPAGEFWVNTVRDQLTIEPGGVHRSILIPREDGASGGRTINVIANNVVNNGVGISVMGGTRARQLAERYLQEDLARQQEMFNRSAPHGNNGEGNGQIKYANQMGGTGQSGSELPASNLCVETRDQRIGR